MGAPFNDLRHFCKTPGAPQLVIIPLFALVIIMLLLSSTEKRPEKLKPIKSTHTQVPEPSDICMHPDKNTYIVVSDDGFLFEMDSVGKIIRKADYKGFDTEGVTVHEGKVYVIEEFTRKIRVFDLETFQLERTVSVPYGGGRNKAFESITFNRSRNCFIMLTEKDPIFLFELDKNLNLINEIDMENVASDISAATWHNGFLWLLSDEDMHVIKLDPTSYKVLNKWYVPIINPEGIAFDRNGRMVIVSDDMERLYFFKSPA
ncbi:MAG: hypothetical protein EA392_00340 [Cryomorphaceae bacterium]|nr:MAG: hypothetical protein EA392_00340 [Cryomorphaceae bacterium]